MITVELAEFNFINLTIKSHSIKSNEMRHFKLILGGRNTNAGIYAIPYVLFSFVPFPFLDPKMELNVLFTREINLINFLSVSPNPNSTGVPFG